MPRKAFLKKKSLLDRFKDDYATHTGYIQSARAKHTWNNPLTRRKRTKELNRWIKSFAGKDHIHKLARFNATNAGRYESMYDEAMSLKGFLENLTEKLTKQFDLDLEEVQAYLNSHTQEMQELLNDTELSLKEKVLFVRSEITGEQDEKKSEKLVVSNPCVVYKGDAENAAKAHDYLYKKMPRVKGASISSDVKPLGNNKFCRVLFYGNNTGVMDLFGYYSNLYNDDFWNNCDADPQGWVDPLTINKYDVATPRQESKDTDEKLGYEKGHKNSKGEDAPWVIRSHEDNRVLASFANEDDAKEHLKRMKQYSKKESKQSEAVSEYDSPIKDWYIKAFPTDDMGEGICGTFKGFLQTLIQGEDIYDYIDVGDSVIRERIFSKLAEMLDVDYDDIYYLWLNDGVASRTLKSKLNKIGLKPTRKNPPTLKDRLDDLGIDPNNQPKIVKVVSNEPDESKKSENATTEEDSIRKAFKSIVNHVPANERSNFDEEFVTDNMEALLDLFNAWFVFDNGEFVTTVRVVDPDNENGDYYDADDEAYQWNACYNVTEGIIDLLGWNYGEETVKQPIQDALFYDFIGTKYIDNSNESKKSESETSSAEQAFKNAADTCGVSDKITITTNGDKVYCIMEMDEDKYGIDHYKWGFDTTTNNLEWYGDESTSGVGAKKKFDNFNDLKSWLIKDIKALFKTHRYESKDLSGYTSDIISKLDGMWACGLNGAKRLAEKYADVIQQNYTDGDLSTAETAKFIAGQENLTESRKKTESKKSEGRLELVDTIVVPKWLWEAFNFGNDYGEDLDEHEQEILAKFQEEYGKYYLDDRSEEADFRSRNDFDQYGGPCYEVDVYEMKKS